MSLFVKLFIFLILLKQRWLIIACVFGKAKVDPINKIYKGDKSSLLFCSPSSNSTHFPVVNVPVTTAQDGKEM